MILMDEGMCWDEWCEEQENEFMTSAECFIYLMLWCVESVESESVLIWGFGGAYGGAEPDCPRVRWMILSIEYRGKRNEKRAIPLRSPPFLSAAEYRGPRFFTFHSANVSNCDNLTGKSGTRIRLRTVSSKNEACTFLSEMIDCTLHLKYNTTSHK
jgi:hypothetical protein